MERTTDLLLRRPVYYQAGARANRYFSWILWMALAMVLAVSSAGVMYVKAATQIEAVQTSTLPVPKTPPVAPAAATILPAPQSDESLEKVIEAWVMSNPRADWSVAVERLDNRQSAYYNAEKQFDPASIYKLYAYYALTQRLPFDQWDDNRTFHGEGSRTLKNCADIMIRLSDNPCAQSISQKLSWTYIDKTSKAEGFTRTNLNRQQGMATTAKDTALFMKKLELGTLINGEAKAQLMASLSGQKWRAGIPAGCIGCETFNKTGDWAGARHDVAIIRSNGKVYTLAIFSSGGSYAQIASLTNKINSYIQAN